MGRGGFTLCDEEIVPLMSLFMRLCFIPLEQYGQKHVFKSWSFRKKIKMGARLSIEGRRI